MEYSEQVAEIRQKLKDLDIRSAKHEFTRKFTEYACKEERDAQWNKTDNLWYGKIQDEEFLTKMKAFLDYKETEYK